MKRKGKLQTYTAVIIIIFTMKIRITIYIHINFLVIKQRIQDIEVSSSVLKYDN